MDPNETINDVFVDELESFKKFWDRLLFVYQPMEIAVLACGLVGNLLALMTFARSKKMCTPSFVYHRALVGADLLFCINFFMHLLVDYWLSIECRQYVFRYWFGAFFSGTLNPAITSICGYVIDYTTLIIALDRFLALISPTGFKNWNRPKVAYSITALTAFLSCAVHSWSSFVQMTVIPFYLNRSDDPLMWQPTCWNDTIVYYWTKRENVSETFRSALKAKEIYNGAARMAYPVALSLLTLGVIVGIIRRQRRRDCGAAKRNTNVGNTTGLGLGLRRPERGSSFDLLELTNFTVQDRFFRDTPMSPDRSNGIRKRKRCERALFLLMTAVLALSFIQVGASEARRLLQLLHPPETILRTKVADLTLPIVDRLWYFRLVLYGHQASKVFSNACTVIERSLICLLYMIMNKLFRRELFALISSCVCFGRRGRQFRQRFDSNLRTGAYEHHRNGGIEIVAITQQDVISNGKRDVIVNL